MLIFECNKSKLVWMIKLNKYLDYTFRNFDTSDKLGLIKNSMRYLSMFNLNFFRHLHKIVT